MSPVVARKVRIGCTCASGVIVIHSVVDHANFS